MTYYRIALQDRQTERWMWKTTVVTSLQAVFELLRSYRMLPQDGMRVFTASSKEELHEMLNQQNNHLPTESVTVAQFLQERLLSAPSVEQETKAVAYASWEMHKAAHRSDQKGNDLTWAKELWEKHQAVQANKQEAAGVATSSLQGLLDTNGTISSLGMSLQERKRLEIELGPGGDHDTPYRFALPVYMPQTLDWMRLRAKVQRGELEP